MTSQVPVDPAARAEQDVIQFCRDLIQMDTSNWGKGSARGELAAAQYCSEILEQAGLRPQIYQSAPGRASVIAKWEGQGSQGSASGRGALVVHGHLDVVPAHPEDWQVDPFAAEILDGMVWGRGAVDMKNMDAMILAAALRLAREGHRPQRDIIFAFFADEEAGGSYGAGWLVKNHPELFTGATEAISEVGGFSTTVAGKRAYLVQTAEKGLHWTKLIAEGTAGHGSAIQTDNPVVRLSEAVARIGDYQWPLSYTKTTRALLEQISDITGIPFKEEDPSELVEAMGSASKFIAASLRNTSNPTVLDAGYKHNVVPRTAEALVDARALPEQHESVAATLADLAGEGIDIEMVAQSDSLEVPFSGALVEDMVSSLQAEDPESLVLPYMLAGGTDNKHLAKLGITGYGFAPLQLPDDLDFTGMFHGVDERVPLDSLVFGVRVLHRFLAAQ